MLEVWAYNRKVAGLIQRVDCAKRLAFNCSPGAVATPAFCTEHVCSLLPSSVCPLLGINVCFAARIELIVQNNRGENSNVTH